MSNKVYIERADYDSLHGESVGLINLYTVRLGEEKAEFLSAKINFEDRKVQWVSEPNVKIDVMMPDGSTRHAIAEPAIKKEKTGSLVQLVRIGFCRIERTEKQTVLYFAHK